MAASEIQVASRRESLNALGYVRALHANDQDQAQYILASCVLDFKLFWSAFSALAVNFLNVIDFFSRDSQQFLANGQRLLKADEILTQLYDQMSVDDPGNWQVDGAA